MPAKHGETINIDPVNPRRCADCGFISGARRGRVLASMQSHHTASRKREAGLVRSRPLAPCRFCRRKGRKDNMDAHAHWNHPGIGKGNQCTQCNYAGFVSEANLREHKLEYCPYEGGKLLEGWVVNESGVPAREGAAAISSMESSANSESAHPAMAPPHPPFNGVFVPILRSTHTPPREGSRRMIASSIDSSYSHQVVDSRFGTTHNPAQIQFQPYNQGFTFNPMLNHWSHNVNTGYIPPLPYSGSSAMTFQGMPDQQRSTYDDFLDYGHHNSPLPPTMHEQDRFGDLLPSHLHDPAYVDVDNLFHQMPDHSLKWSLAKRLSPRQLYRYGRYLVD